MVSHRRPRLELRLVFENNRIIRWDPAQPPVQIFQTESKNKNQKEIHSDTIRDMLCSMKKITKKKTEVVHVRLSAEMMEALRRKAVQDQRPVAWLVARAAERGMAR